MALGSYNSSFRYPADCDRIVGCAGETTGNDTMKRKVELMHSVGACLLAAGVPMAAMIAAPAKAQTAKPVATVVGGWIERVSFPALGLVFEGKLDTGADSSSINASEVRVLFKTDRRYVSFIISDDTGKSTRVELPHTRWVRIRRTGGGYDRRPVVRLTVCVGGFSVESDFTIADSKTLDYQVLIGRKILAGRLLVDSGSRHRLAATCPSPQ